MPDLIIPQFTNTNPRARHETPFIQNYEEILAKLALSHSEFHFAAEELSFTISEDLLLSLNSTLEDALRRTERLKRLFQSTQNRINFIPTEIIDGILTKQSRELINSSLTPEQIKEIHATLLKHVCSLLSAAGLECSHNSLRVYSRPLNLILVAKKEQ